MMKRFYPALFALLLVILLTPAAAAEDSARTYSYPEEDAVVPVYELFLSVYENDRSDIRLECGETVWYFSCENVFRNTEKWADFSACVTVSRARELPDKLSETLEGREVLLIDFRDGDLFPGPAEISFPAGTPGTEYALLEYGVSESGNLLLTPVAEHLTPGPDGRLTLTLTEAHDFLLIEGDPGLLAGFAPEVTLPSEGSPLRTVLISVLIALALSAVAYLIIRIVLKRSGKR